MKKLLLLAFILYSFYGFSQCKQACSLFEHLKINDIRFEIEAPSADSFILNMPWNNSVRITARINGTLLYNVSLTTREPDWYDTTLSVKKSFKIELNKYKANQNFEGITSFNLNNLYGDPSCMREWLFYKLMENEHLKVPKCAYANVYLNNKFIGLYTLVENIDSTFLSKTYGDSEYLIKGAPRATLELKGNSMKEYSEDYTFLCDTAIVSTEFQKLLRAINLPSKNYKDKKDSLNAIFETSECIKIWAISSIVGNIDTYSSLYAHNYYLHYSRADGKFHWIPENGSYSFMKWSPNFSMFEAIHYSSTYIAPGSTRPLAELLFNHPDFLYSYLNYAYDILKKKYTNEFMFSLVDEISLAIRPSVYADTNKQFTNEEFDLSIYSHHGNIKDPGAFTPGIIPYWQERREALLKELDKRK